MKAKIFISHHPSNLFLFKDIARIIRKYDQNSRIILFKVKHYYFSKFNDEPYKKNFDNIVEFDFINYDKNFIKSYLKIFNFKKKLKEEIKNLEDFESIDVFSTDSAWFPVNVLLYHLSREKNVKNINRFSMGSHLSSQTKTDKKRTFLCRFYSLPFKCFKIKAISTLTGKFVDFSYVDEMPGRVIDVVSPTIDNFALNQAPYPVIMKEELFEQKKDMVVVFGDSSLFDFYSEYLPSHKIFVEKLTTLFKTIESKYPDCKLYYKSHPSNKDKIMPGIDVGKYSLFDDSVNAESIFDSYGQRIKAVYTISSVSVVISSFLGIPSYTFYHYLFNANGIKKLDDLFNRKGSESKFLFHISDLKEVGNIDSLNRQDINLTNINDNYRKLLKI